MEKILITGTSQGSGYTIAKRFLELGYMVIGMDVLPEPRDLEENGDFIFYNIDVGDKTALPELTGISYIVVNAATQDEPKCIKSNLYGYLNVCEKYAFNEGVKAVLFMGSISAIAGIDLPMYCMTKGANRSYAKNLAMRLAPKGVLVNMLTLGPTETPMNDVLSQQQGQNLSATAERPLIIRLSRMTKRTRSTFRADLTTSCRRGECG